MHSEVEESKALDIRVKFRCWIPIDLLLLLFFSCYLWFEFVLHVIFCSRYIWLLVRNIVSSKWILIHNNKLCFLNRWKNQRNCILCIFSTRVFVFCSDSLFMFGVYIFFCTVNGWTVVLRHIFFAWRMMCSYEKWPGHWCAVFTLNALCCVAFFYSLSVS